MCRSQLIHLIPTCRQGWLSTVRAPCPYRPHWERHPGEASTLGSSKRKRGDNSLTAPISAHNSTLKRVLSIQCLRSMGITLWNISTLKNLSKRTEAIWEEWKAVFSLKLTSERPVANSAQHKLSACAPFLESRPQSRSESLPAKRRPFCKMRGFNLCLTNR